MIARLCVLCLLCAEAFAIYTFGEMIAVGFGHTNPHAVAAWAVLATVLVAYSLPQLANGFFLSDRSARIALTLAALVVIYIGVRATVVHNVALWDLGWARDFLERPEQALNRGSHAMIATFVLLGAWLWGSHRSNSEIEPELVARNVAVPFVLVTAMVIVGAGSHRAGEIGRGAVGFYVFEVLALALSQLVLSGATIGTLRSGGVAAALLGGTVGAVVAGVLLVTLVFGVIQPAFGPALGDAVTRVLTWAVTPLAWVLQHFFDLLFQGNKFPKIEPATLQPSHVNQKNGGPSTADTIGLYALRALGIVIVALVVAGSIALVARLRRKSPAAADPTFQALSAGSLGSDLGDVFRRLFRRPARTDLTASDEATALYLDVLREAERRGHSRPLSATPAEFAAPLRSAFASSTTDEITRAFEQARYAGRAPDADTIRYLRERWLEVR